MKRGNVESLYFFGILFGALMMVLCGVLMIDSRVKGPPPKTGQATVSTRTVKFDDDKKGVTLTFTDKDGASDSAYCRIGSDGALWVSGSKATWDADPK